MSGTLTLGAITLPVDLEWVDEFTFSHVSQQREVTLGGSILLEESAQLAARPITLRSGASGSSYFGLIDRATLVALQAAADTARDTPLLLTLPDDRTFDVYFNHGELAVDARPVRHVWPPADDDLYQITVRLITAE